MTKDSILHFLTPASPSLDASSLSLQKALLKFAPLFTAYADIPYAEAFNWSELSLPLSEEREWYCVAFRSKRRAGSDSQGDFWPTLVLTFSEIQLTQALHEADRKAHEEGDFYKLLMYWYGVPDVVTGMNLATCIWQSRRHAVAANTRPHHRKATELTAKSYEHYTLERYKLVKLRGESSIFIMPYEGGEVGW